MRDYLSPERNRVALLTIDAQRDFCMSSGRSKSGCSAPFIAAVTRLTTGFRAKGRPIVELHSKYSPALIPMESYRAVKVPTSTYDLTLLRDTAGR